MPSSRYAIYYAPAADSALWRLASRWLGRDAVSGEVFLDCPDSAFPAPDWDAIVRSPRAYGFHATLKPPFPLAPGRTPESLTEAVTALARSLRRVELPPLQLSELGRFLALTLSVPSPALEDLAARCVEELDPWRRPASAAELDARRTGLSARQTELLERWGYPYVLDQWKFHLTLTSSIGDHVRRAEVFAYLSAQFESVLHEPATVADLAIFFQPGTGAPFTLAERIPLAA